MGRSRRELTRIADHTAGNVGNPRQALKYCEHSANASLAKDATGTETLSQVLQPLGSGRRLQRILCLSYG